MKLKRFSIVVAFLLLFLLPLGYIFHSRNNTTQEHQQLSEGIATLEAENLKLVTQHATVEANLNELQEQHTIPAIIPPASQVTDTIITVSDTAFAHQIATDVLIQLDKQYDRAMLLAVEAFRLADTPTTRSALMYALQHNIHLKAVFPNENWGWAESVAFSPDGRFLVVGHSGSQVTLYNLSSESLLGQPLTGLIEQGGEETGLISVTFSPDSQLVMATHAVYSSNLYDYEGYQTVVWNVLTHEIIATGQEHSKEFAFLPDGKHLISQGVESVVSWEIVPNQELQEKFRLPVSIDPWQSFPIAVHPTEGLVAISYQEGRIDLWNPFTGEIETSFTPALTTTIKNLAYSPNGSLLAINTPDTLILWDTIQEQLVGEPIAAAPTTTKFSADGQSLLIVNRDETFEVLNINTMESQSQPLQRWGNARLLMDIDLHPNGHFIVSSYKTGEVLLWDILSIPRIGTMLPTSNVPHSFIDETILAAVSASGAIEFWDVSSGELLTQTSGFDHPYLRDFVFNEDYTIAATRVFTNGISTISLLDPLNNQPIVPPITPTVLVSSFALNSQGSILVTGDIDGVLRLWDTSTGLMINDPMPGHNHAINTITFSPDEKIIASGGYYELLLRDSESLQLVIPPISVAADKLVFHPNKPILVSIQNGGFPTYMWDYTNGNFLGEVIKFQEGLEELSGLVFSSNNQFAASAHLEHIDFGRRLPFMVLRDGTSLQQIGPNLESYWISVFNPSGNFLASAYRKRNGDNELFVWNLDTEFWIDQICHTVNRNLSEQEWNLYFSGKPYRETCPISQ